VPSHAAAPSLGASRATTAAVLVVAIAPVLM
jgi:hypothetical protein